MTGQEQPLLSTNLYAARGKIAVVGACLSEMAPDAWAEAVADCYAVYPLCLEETHLNMAVAKLTAMLATGGVTGVVFASVDRSPHCTQLHYIHHELLRTLPGTLPIRHFVARDGACMEIDAGTIELSKSLAVLQETREGQSPGIQPKETGR